MVWVIGHYPDCNSGRPCLVVDDYKKKHNFRPEVGGFAAYVLFKKMLRSDPHHAYSTICAFNEHYRCGLIRLKINIGLNSV